MEEDNEWETIQPSSSSSSSSTSTTHSDEDDGDTVVIIQTPTTNSHQPIPVSPPQPPSPPSSLSVSVSVSSSLSSNSTEIVLTDGELPQPPEVRITLINATLRILRLWALRVCYGIRSRIRFFAIAAFVTVTAFAWRWNRRRRISEKDYKDKMLLLINQKDEKIKQLLLQIDRMNEAISGRRRVPVLRVVVDKPLVVGPRPNWKPT